MKITAHEVLLLQAAVNELIASGQTCPGDLLQTAVSKFATAIRVSTVRADGDTADVPEILDLLIHGGPLDKWGHPVLDITEVTRYLTNDTNAEVLPK